MVAAAGRTPPPVGQQREQRGKIKDELLMRLGRGLDIAMECHRMDDSEKSRFTLCVREST